MPRRYRRKATEGSSREERLRQIRGAAQTLRSTCPSAALVNVKLDFLADDPQTHAAQAFVLYPGARAVFFYPCPYGDCDGVYDLSSEADQTLNRQRPRVAGISRCPGTRSRAGQPKASCGLSVRYTIVAKHEQAQVST